MPNHLILNRHYLFQYGELWPAGAVAGMEWPLVDVNIRNTQLHSGYSSPIFGGARAASPYPNNVGYFDLTADCTLFSQTGSNPTTYLGVGNLKDGNKPRFGAMTLDGYVKLKEHFNLISAVEAAGVFAFNHDNGVDPALDFRPRFWEIVTVEAEHPASAPDAYFIQFDGWFTSSPYIAWVPNLGFNPDHIVFQIPSNAVENALSGVGKVIAADLITGVEDYWDEEGVYHAGVPGGGTVTLETYIDLSEYERVRFGGVNQYIRRVQSIDGNRYYVTVGVHA